MYAVADVKDVSGPARRPPQDGHALTLHDLPGRLEHDGIEISLYCMVESDRSQATSSGIRQSTPITLPPASAIASSRAPVLVPK